MYTLKRIDICMYFYYFYLHVYIFFWIYVRVILFNIKDGIFI